MKLALIGFPIDHSKSPELYQKFLGAELDLYDLISVDNSRLLPQLEDLSKIYNGINITTPYKECYLNQVKITDNKIKQIGAINTIAFTSNGWFGTNTDLLAVQILIKRFYRDYPNVFFIILGNGVMAKMTKIVLSDLSLPFLEFSRSKDKDISKLDLSYYADPSKQFVVINACSRSFIFKGKLSPEMIFWDFNYSFYPHEQTIPSKVKIYLDGLEMLELQAQEAIRFWKSKSKPNS